MPAGVQDRKYGVQGEAVIPLEKNILIQYCDMKEEIKDLRKRINKLSVEINKLTPVSDSVKGTRRDGTIGSIKVTGYPYPMYERKKAIMEIRKLRLMELEAKLLELTNDVEDYINGIENSELRIMFRLYYVNDLSYAKVAMQMNAMFPKRKIKYTDENVKKRMNRFLNNF